MTEDPVDRDLIAEELEAEAETAAEAAKPAARRRSPMAKVGSTALAKVFVMGISGVLAIFTSRLIITSFGTEAYGQYGLLTTITTLLPFADLGIAAMVINSIAGSSSVRTDVQVRRTIVTAFRILLTSGAVIAGLGGVVTLLGGWHFLLGDGLIPGSGGTAAFICLLVFGVTLPLTVGQRILVGMQRTSTQVASQAVVAPFMLLSIFTVSALSAPVGSYLAVFSYIGNGLVSVICIIVSARLLSPQLRLAVKELPRLRSAPGVPVMATAWPMLAQMLALPVAMQTDRLLLSHLSSSDQLASYNLASQMFGIVLQTVATAGVALWPIYAKARVNASIESPARPTLYFLTGGLALGGLLALASPWLVGFISDDKITIDGWLLGGFVAFAALQASKYPIGMYMTDARGLRFQVLPILIMIVVNLGFSWWLIGLIGAGGSVIGSAIGVATCQVLPNLIYVRRDLAKRRAEAARIAADPV
jgi:O-antigen/teichoic acid export membrane protein